MQLIKNRTIKDRIKKNNLIGKLLVGVFIAPFAVMVIHANEKFIVPIINSYKHLNMLQI